MPIMANEVRIPKYMTVHLGSPNNYARNITLPDFFCLKQSTHGVV